MIMSNKHQPYDLKQMQSLPLEAKIMMSTRRIELWFDHWDGEVYVSFSGGKDSTVLADLVARFCKRYGYKMYLLFVNTGLEYPEIQKFVKTFAEWLRNTHGIEVQLDILRPEMRFDQVIKKYGYPAISKDVSSCIYWAKRGSPTRLKRLNGELIMKNGQPSMFNCSKWKFMLDAPFEVSNECCKIMKKNPSKKYEKETGRKPILGLLAEESIKRQSAWMKTGCNAFDIKRPQSQPIAFWTEQDILHYLKKYNVPYCSVYGDIIVREKETEYSVDGQMTIYDALEDYEGSILESTGCNRTGCIFCMFGCHLEKEPNRFQRLKETHPRQYEYCINGGEMVDGKWQPNKEGLGLGKVLDYIGVDYD